MNTIEENKNQPVDILDTAEHAVTAAKKMAEGNINVFSAEFKLVMSKLRPRLVRTAIFGSLLVLGLLAFLSFAIVGLGVLLNEQYWLSSLLVAIVFSLVGGFFSFRSLQGVSDLMQFERTIRSVDRTVEAAKYSFEEIKSAASGVNRESVNAGK